MIFHSPAVTWQPGCIADLLADLAFTPAETAPGMSVIILPCEKCGAPTPHRTPSGRSEKQGDQQKLVQCDVCGSLRPALSAVEERTTFGIDAARVISTIPALSQKQAHGKLEELLYEFRDAILAMDAFQEAAAATDASEFELQDIKIQKYERGQGAWIVNFKFYALGTAETDGDDGEIRIDGTGVGSITDQGSIEISDVIATATR